MQTHVIEYTRLDDDGNVDQRYCFRLERPKGDSPNDEFDEGLSSAMLSMRVGMERCSALNGGVPFALKRPIAWYLQQLDRDVLDGVDMAFLFDANADELIEIAQRIENAVDAHELRGWACHLMHWSTKVHEDFEEVLAWARLLRIWSDEQINELLSEITERLAAKNALPRVDEPVKNPE